MGSTSITGSGPGEGISRGPANQRNQYVSLLDPHVVLAGNAVTSTGGGDPDSQGFRTIYMPSNLIMPATKLTVMIGGKPVLNQKILDGDGNLTAFVVWDQAVGGGYTFDYVVMDAVSDNFADAIGT